MYFREQFRVHFRVYERLHFWEQWLFKVYSQMIPANEGKSEYAALKVMD